MAAPTERRVSTAVPLGDRQRRSDDADGSGYVSPVGPPLLVAVERRMCRVLTVHLQRASAASLSGVSMQVSERERWPMRAVDRDSPVRTRIGRAPGLLLVPYMS